MSAGGANPTFRRRPRCTPCASPDDRTCRSSTCVSAPVRPIAQLLAVSDTQGFTFVTSEHLTPTSAELEIAAGDVNEERLRAHQRSNVRSLNLSLYADKFGVYYTLQRSLSGLLLRRRL